MGSVDGVETERVCGDGNARARVVPLVARVRLVDRADLELGDAEGRGVVAGAEDERFEP